MQASFSRVMVVFDPRSGHHPALAPALRLAATASEMHAYGCVYDPALSGDHFFDSARLRRSRAGYRQRMVGTLRKIAAPLGRGKASLQVDLGWGKPFYREVLRKAAALEADLLIIGQHDPTGSEYTNAEWHLIRAVACPLLIARPRTWAEEPLIVAALDPVHRQDQAATLDRRILRQSHRLARALRGSCRAFFAYDKAALQALGLRGVAVESRLKQHLRKLGKEVKLSARNIDVTEGKAAAAIADYVARRKADVIALGAISRSLVGRVLIGSTAEQVMRRVDCDLLIVKPEGFVSPVE